jgi:hypothetical protein
MTRPRRSSAASEDSTATARDQELGSMYDYLAKIILLGPSGTGKYATPPQPVLLLCPLHPPPSGPTSR